MGKLSTWAIGISAAAFALLILNVAVSTYNIDALIANDREVSHARDVSRALADLISEMKDAETGQRGFQITGKNEYLEPFTAAQKSVPGLIEHLGKLTANDPYYEQTLPRLIATVEKEFKELDRAVALRKVDREVARAEILKGDGKEIMDDLRAVVAEMDRHQDAIFAARSSVAHDKFRSTTFTAVFGGVLTIVMVALAVLVVRRELSRRLAAQSAARQAALELVGSQRETADTLALLEAFLDNAPIGIAFFDPELRYLRINDHLAAANGREVAAHLGRTIPEAVPNMPPVILADLQEVTQSRRALLNREVTGRPGQPDRVWLTSYFPVRTKDGGALGVGLVAQDVTERLVGERRLRENEARKAAILETALDCVISIDNEGKVIEFNPAAERTFGYTRADVMGHELSALIVPAIHRDGHAAGLRRFLETGHGPVLNRRIEMPALRKDGVEFPAEMAITAITLGTQTIFTAYLRDITERKRAENAVRQSLERFRTLVEALPQLVIVTDPQGGVTSANGRWVDYTGLHHAADWLAAVHPDDADSTRAAWQSALDTAPDRFVHECRMRADDGNFRWMLLTAVPLRIESGAVVQWVTTFGDIEDQKRQRETLMALVKIRTNELESSNQLLRDEITERTRAEGRAQASAVELGRSNEELEKFAYVASHDLQEPLRKIQSFGDRLVKKHRNALDADGQEYLDRMQASAARMRKLIDDLLVFSRVGTKGQVLAPVDLRALVDDVLSDLEVRLTQTEGRVEVGDLPTLPADPVQMRQLFQNLIGNALKFHRPGIPPIVTIGAAAWDSLAVDVDPPRPAGTGLRITLADNGIGFNQEYAERVFEVFQRLHGRGEYEGTGIGLAICRKIVQRHGGDIVARSHAGQGATFIIDLPVGAR